MVYWSALCYVHAHTQRYTGVYLFHNERCDAVFPGSHVSFGIDDQNISIWSIRDPKLTAIENVVVTCTCMFVCVWWGERWRRELSRIVCVCVCACVCVCCGVRDGGGSYMYGRLCVCVHVHVCVSRVGEGGRTERNEKRRVCVCVCVVGGGGSVCVWWVEEEVWRE